MGFHQSFFPNKETNKLDKNNTYQSTISDAIDIINCGVLVLALAEHYKIKTTNILAISPGILPRIFLDQESFTKLSKEKIEDMIFCKEDNSILIQIAAWHLKQFSSLNIFKKFPHFFAINKRSNYFDPEKKIENQDLIARCKLMQMMWSEWNDAGLPHFISSLQALQRHIASQMKKPLSPDFELKLDNGLSIEYQAEIYSNHLYGAKLLDAWHTYLVGPEPEKKHPQLFLNWLKSLTKEQLLEFGINNLDDIPIVKYMTNSKERALWHLTISADYIVTSNQLPPPKSADEEIEIIYTLGKLERNKLDFLGGMKKRGTINHSSFFSGEKVDGAGRMLLKAQEDKDKSLHWVIHELDNNSGHIKPTDSMSINVLKTLKSYGCDLHQVHWKSKWGSPGASDETAETAYKRLTANCENIQLSYAIAEKNLTSPFLQRLNNYAQLGFLGAIDDLLNTHIITTAEALTTAILIQNALENHLKIFSSVANPITVKELSNRAIDYLQMLGKKSEVFENDLKQLLNKYQLNYNFYLKDNLCNSSSPLEKTRTFGCAANFRRK